MAQRPGHQWSHIGTGSLAQPTTDGPLSSASPHTTAASAAGPNPRPGGPRKPHQHHPLDQRILAREMLAAPRRGWVSDQKAGRPRAAACGLVARETIRGEFLGILISGEERPHESAAWSELNGEGHKERLLRSEWGSGAASGQSRSSWVKLAERLPLCEPGIFPGDNSLGCGGDSISWRKAQA